MRIRPWFGSTLLPGEYHRVLGVLFRIYPRAPNRNSLVQMKCLALCNHSSMAVQTAFDSCFLLRFRPVISIIGQEGLGQVTRFDV